MTPETRNDAEPVLPDDDVTEPSPLRGGIRLKLAMDLCRWAGTPQSFRSFFPGVSKAGGAYHNLYTPLQIRQARLKMLGVETVLVRVPGESHGIRNRPNHWMSKVTTVTGWFDQHRTTMP